MEKYEKNNEERKVLGVTIDSLPQWKLFSSEMKVEVCTGNLKSLAYRAIEPS